MAIVSRAIKAISFCRCYGGTACWLLWELCLWKESQALVVRFAYCFSAPCLDISLNPVSATYSELQCLADVLCPELVLAVDFPRFGSKHESLGLELHPPVQPLETTGCPPAICTYNAKEFKPGRPSSGFSSSIFPFNCKFCSDEQI